MIPVSNDVLNCIFGGCGILGFVLGMYLVVVRLRFDGNATEGNQGEKTMKKDAIKTPYVKERTIKYCPVLWAGPGESRCMGDGCAWYSAFAESCSIPLLAGMFADSDMCRNVFDVLPQHVGDGGFKNKT